MKQYLQAIGCAYAKQENKILEWGKILPHFKGYTINEDGHLDAVVIAVFKLYVEHYELTPQLIAQRFGTPYIAIYGDDDCRWYDAITGDHIAEPFFQQSAPFIEQEASLHFIYKEMQLIFQQQQFTAQQIEYAFICWNLAAMYKRRQRISWAAFYNATFAQKVFHDMRLKARLFHLQYEHLLNPTLLHQMVQFMQFIHPNSEQNVRTLAYFLRQPTEPFPNAAESFLEHLLTIRQWKGSVLLFNNSTIPLSISLTHEYVQLTVFEQTEAHYYISNVISFLLQHASTTVVTALPPLDEKFDYIIYAPHEALNCSDGLLRDFAHRLAKEGELIIVHENDVQLHTASPFAILRSNAFCIQDADIYITHFKLKEEL